MLSKPQSEDDTVGQKCAFSPCKREHCKTPWHKPCMLAKYDLVENIRPMLVVVGGSEVAFGLVIIVLMVLYGDAFDELYGTFRVMTMACLSGSVTLFIIGGMLISSLFWSIRRLMLVHLFISTILGIYIFVLSVFQMHYGLLIIKKDQNTQNSGCTINQHFLSSAACILGLMTLLGSVVHFVGNIIVFTYYNLKYIQPLIFQSSDNT